MMIVLCCNVALKSTADRHGRDEQMTCSSRVDHLKGGGLIR